MLHSCVHRGAEEFTRMVPSRSLPWVVLRSTWIVDMEDEPCVEAGVAQNNYILQDLHLLISYLNESQRHNKGVSGS